MQIRRGFEVLVAALLLSGVSCSKPVLTDSLRERYALNEADLRHVQLYTSEEIVLRREITGQDKSLSGSELRIRDGVRVEEVVIRAKTPCVALRVEGLFMLVGFSPQRPDLSLWFALNTKGEAPPEGRRYEVAALANPPNDPAPFTPVYAKGFLVTYGGQKYRVADERSWGVHLLVDLEESFARDRVRQEAPGWRLSDKPVPSSPPSPASAAPTATPPRDAGASP